MQTDIVFTKLSRAHVVISFTQSYVTQGGEPRPMLTCEGLSLSRIHTIPSRDDITWYKWTCLPVECSKQVGSFCFYVFLKTCQSLQVFDQSCSNLFETRCWRWVQNKHIFTKINQVNEIKHWINCHCLSQQVLELESCQAKSFIKSIYLHIAQPKAR